MRRCFPQPSASPQNDMSTQTKLTKTQALYERALKVLPGGVSRNTVLRDPHPSYAAYGRGCRLTDIEGVTRIDFANNMASLIHGHACPEVVHAVTEQLAKGTAYTLATEVEVRYAEHLCSRNSTFEKLRFVNSGTEAMMVALKAARAFTGRPKIAKVEGAYHGLYDYAEVSQATDPTTWGDIDRPRSVPLVHGTPDSVLHEVIVIPFNDPKRAIAILDEHTKDLACVLIDLMPHRAGLTLATPEFVSAIRDWTKRHSVLLVLDEVITFRAEYGGLQERYQVRPDITAMGKMIGGGFPIGAVAGRADVMDVLNPRAKKLLFPHAGTFSANPISITAGLVAMEKFDKPAVAQLNARTDRAIKGIRDAIKSNGACACVTGGGSMFRVHLKQHPPRDFRETYPSPDEKRKLRRLLDHLFDEGFIMIDSGSAALSTPMTDADIDALVHAFSTGFKKITAEP